MKRWLLLALLFAGCVSEAPQEETPRIPPQEYKVYPGDNVGGYELTAVGASAVFCKVNDCRYLGAGDDFEYREGKCMHITEVSEYDRYAVVYVYDC